MMETPIKTPTESVESKLLVMHAFDLARSLGIKKLLVHADLLVDRRSIDKHREEECIIWLTREDDTATSWKPDKRDHLLQLPAANLGRMDQVHVGLLLAVLRDFVGLDESILCLTGIAGSQRLDNLLITNPNRDNPWFRKDRLICASPLFISRTFGRLLGLALRFAAEGREGKPIGTIFVIGELKQLEPYLKQLILNPCKGHPKKLRNVNNPDFVESLRELASLDGAFVVSPTGVVERAAAYLDAPLRKRITLRPGLGARHMAAAAISSKSDSIAIVISESSGTIAVFHDGMVVLEIERPSMSSQAKEPTV